MSDGLKKKYWFEQDWGTLQDNTLVFVNHDFKSTVQVLKRIKYPAELAKALLTDIKPVLNKNNNAFIWYYDGDTALFLRHWKNDWQHVETLIHELNHLLFYRMKDYGMTGEPEAMAYQQEYLFRSIRRKLQTFIDKEKKNAKRTK